MAPICSVAIPRPWHFTHSISFSVITAPWQRNHLSSLICKSRSQTGRPWRDACLSHDGAPQRGWDQDPKPDFQVGCLTSLTTSQAKLHLPSSLLELSAWQTPTTFPSLPHPLRLQDAGAHPALCIPLGLKSQKNPIRLLLNQSQQPHLQQPRNQGASFDSSSLFYH